MITTKTGNILTSTAELIAIPVNCVGLPGAGLAKAWAKHDPAAAEVYREECREHYAPPPWVFFMAGRRWVLCATKDDWRQPSRMEWVRGCLTVLRQSDRWQSLAVPLLGAGLGGLSPLAVMQATEAAFASDPRMVEVYTR